MNLVDAVAKLMMAPSLSAMVHDAKGLNKPTAAKTEATIQYEQLKIALREKSHRRAVALTLALLLLDGDAWLGRMRRDGLLRASRYGYHAACLKKVVAAATDIAAHISLSPTRTQYLESVQTLLELAESAKVLHRSVVQRLRSQHKSGLKTLLALVNWSFTIDWPGSHGLGAQTVAHLSSTDMASAFSRLYMISRDELGICDKAWHLTDDHAAGLYESLYSSLLLDAFKLNELVDAEVLIDGLPYQAKSTSTGVLVSSIDADLERAVRLGYIQIELQMGIRTASAYKAFGEGDTPIPSFKEELKSILSAGLLDFVERAQHPIERLVIKLPEFEPLFDFLRLEAPFLEEIPLLQGASLECFHSWEKESLWVSKDLTAIDLLKVQRLFNFIDRMFHEKLESIDDIVERRKLRLRSTVMVIKRTDLLTILRIVISEAKAEALIGLLLLSQKASTKEELVERNEYIDLQYRPFVHSLGEKGEHIAVAPAVVAKSNLIRSVMHFSNIKKLTPADQDPMQVAVAEALRASGFLVKDSFEFNIFGKRETDIFCFRDGFLFVLECKNAYHPCSPHELRNSHDLVVKAMEQLDIRENWLKDPENQRELFKALGWNVPLPIQTRTCCVTANRCFTGYQNGGHPVRQAHELINVLRRGYIADVLSERQHSFWHGEIFQVRDLIDYLDGKSIVQMQHDSMVPIQRSVDIMGRTLEFAQFRMAMEDVAHHVEARFSPMRSIVGHVNADHVVPGTTEPR